jgi:FkbM family methyltransferase
MASKKLFIAVPVYGALEPNFTLSLFRLVMDKPCDMGLDLKIGDSLVSRARNAQVAKFLKSDCTDMLFIDSDLIFTPDHVKRILGHDEPLVGGFYVKKKEGNPEFVVNTFEKLDPPRADGLQKVKYVGTGFMKISRIVFEKMIEKYKDEIAYHPDEQPPDAVEYDFFSVGRYKFPDGTTRYLSEDWFFCQRWLDLGGEVWADAAICCKHVGPACYPLKTQEAQIFGPRPDTAGDAAVDATVLPAGFFVPPELSLPKPSDGISEMKDILDGCYDIPGLKEPPRTVLDAGAHVGLFTYWAKKKWPNAQVTAFEPESQNLQWLCHNLHNMQGVTIVHSALSDHNNELVLRKGHNSLTHSIIGEGVQFTVPCKDASTIGSFDIVKVDTEGSETSILSKLDVSKTMGIVVETHSDFDACEVRVIGERRGFKLVSDAETIKGCRLLKFARPSALIDNESKVEVPA